MLERWREEEERWASCVKHIISTKSNTMVNNWGKNTGWVTLRLPLSAISISDLNTGQSASQPVSQSASHNEML